MFYLAPRDFWYFGIPRLTVTFDDGSEDFGTGFLVDNLKHYYLVTARHVVDASYRPAARERNKKCVSIRLDYVAFAGDMSLNNKAVCSLLIQEPNFCFDAESADCAAIQIAAASVQQNIDENLFRPYSFSEEFIATDIHLELRHAGEPIIFIGYPGNSPLQEYYAFHKSFNHIYPLLRQGVLAFPTSMPVKVDGFLGANYGVLDSFAQKGFSGAPVISLQKGYPGGQWNSPEDYRPPNILGVVCGHYRSASDASNGAYSGLSYFVRSNSIRAIFSMLSDRNAIF